MGTGRGDVLAKHMIQSFLPDEITPDEAMEIGRKLVKSFLHDENFRNDVRKGIVSIKPPEGNFMRNKKLKTSPQTAAAAIKKSSDTFRALIKCIISQI